MEWKQFTKKQKKAGRPSRRPVEKLQTLAWFYCLATMLNVNTKTQNDEQIVIEVDFLLDEKGYVGPKTKINSESEPSCKGWFNGSHSPNPESNEQICKIVDADSPGSGIKLWSTFYYGIDGCFLWHRFDQFNQDPTYNLPRNFFPAPSQNLKKLSAATDNGIRYLTREAAMPAIPTPIDISNHLFIGGLLEATQDCSHELEAHGITPKMYIATIQDQTEFLLLSDPVKYNPADFLLVE